MKRGRSLWDSIYAPHADKLHDKLGSYHPDFICKYTFQDSDDFLPIAAPRRPFSADRDSGATNWKFLEDLCLLIPLFSAFIIQSYGTILAPMPGNTKTYLESVSTEDLSQGNLSRALGSVVGVATLRSEGRVGPQLVSHVFGLLKARYAEAQNEEDAWLSTDEGTEWVIRTVDEIFDAVSSEGKDDRTQVKL